MTVDGKFLGNDSNPIERKIFDQFSKGLPKEKQASYLLYNLLPEASSSALALGRQGQGQDAALARHRVADYDLQVLHPGQLHARGQDPGHRQAGPEVSILSSFEVCAGWVHTLDGVLWPATRPEASAIPGPVKGGVASPLSRRAAAPGLAPVAFSADAVSLPGLAQRVGGSVEQQ